MDWLLGNIEDIAFKVGVDPASEDLTWTTQVDSETVILDKEPDQSLGDTFFINLLRLIPMEDRV